MAEVTSTEYIELKRSVELLELGMYITRLDRPWEETDFVYQGFQLNTLEELHAVQQQCEFVYLRSAKQKWHIEQESQNPIQEKVKYINKISIDKELNNIRSAYKNACSETSALLSSIRLSGELDAHKVNQLVDTNVQSILRNDTALTWLSQIRDKNNFLAEHVLRTCIYAISLGKVMGFKELELQNIGVCGLLHDIGMIKIPDEIITKKEALTTEEIHILQQHPIYGKKLLISKSGIYPGAVDVACYHHERLDGSGYPRGLTAERIPYYAKIISIIDAYDTMTSATPYSQAVSSRDACRHLYQNKNTLFDAKILNKFIHFIGIYAPGSLVEMNTSEVGIIIEVDNLEGIKPRILLILGSDKKETNHRFIDLSVGNVSLSNTRYEIKRSLPHGAYGINIENYLDKIIHTPVTNNILP